MKQFKDLSKEEKLELIEAQLDGKDIQFYDGQGWLRTIDTASVIFYFDVRYRVAETKDEFTNWDILPSEYKWIARDEYGVVKAFQEKPQARGGIWWRKTNKPPIDVTRLTCFKQGTVDYKDSLIKRPE